MKCSDPVLCYAHGNKKTYRNWSLASEIHRQLAQQVFDCNRCLACRQKYARQLAMRCVLHSSLYLENAFLTLTYDETKKGYTNNPHYPDIQNFKKSLRRYAERNGSKRIQVFNVMEYGKNGKKHWHLIVFNFNFGDRKEFYKSDGNTLYTSKTLDRLWKHGHCTIGDVTMASAMYQAQYTQKDLKYSNQDLRRAKSNHSGIGKAYFLEHFRQILGLGYVPFDGQKYPIPRYFLKIAHRHFAHFYDRQYFFGHPRRKEKYKFLCCAANKEMADLYYSFKQARDRAVADLAIEWEKNIKRHIYRKTVPDFVRSGENRLYDFRNFNSGEDTCI